MKEAPMDDRDRWNRSGATDTSNSKSKLDDIRITPKAIVFAAAGIIILATLSAYKFWIWVLTQVLGLATEFQGASLVAVIQRGDPWDLVRTAIAIVGAGVLTFLSWLIAVGIADDL
jgi:hypothetical protein